MKICEKCGATMRAQGDNSYVCDFCGATFADKSAPVYNSQRADMNSNRDYVNQAANMTNGYNQGSTGGNGNYFPPQTKPDNFMVWAVLCTVFCCLPFGIVSIIQASKVNNLWSSGDYDGAMDAANKAKTWFWWGFGVGLAVIIIYSIILVLGGFAAIINNS